MLFKSAQDQLSLEVTKIKDDQETLNRIKNALNFGKSEVSKYSLWKHLEVPNNEVLIIPQYTTGMAAVTQDSRVVTLGGGAVASSNFQGRFFKGQQSASQYEILSVDTIANTLTLKTPIIETSQTYLYTIWKKFYRVPSDIRVVLPNMEYADMPIPFEIHGYDDYAADYSVSASFTEGSNQVIGSGFLDRVFPGDTITQESNVYRVQRVLSDTLIVMTNLAIVTFTGNVVFSSDTPYKARLVGYANPFANRLGIIYDPTGKSILNYSYIRTLYPMIANGDDTELPHYFDRAILDFACAEYKRGTNSESWQGDLQLGQARLQKLELDSNLVHKSKKTFRQYIPSGLGRGRYYGGPR